MNYQHYFHAGNFADVFKHLILCICLEKFHEKDSPFFVLDTHAGSGKYWLHDDRVQKTGEAACGIKKILSNPDSLSILPLSFLQILSQVNSETFEKPDFPSEFLGRTNCEKVSVAKPRCSRTIWSDDKITKKDGFSKVSLRQISDLPSKISYYPGSPVIIKNFLRKNDRAIFAENQEQVFAELRRNFSGSLENAAEMAAKGRDCEGFLKIFCEKKDGLSFLKSALPPLERRGLIIIDPAYEKDQSRISADYFKVVEGLKSAKKRFAHGVYLLWHPIIDGEEEFLSKFYQKIHELNFDKTTHFVFETKVQSSQIEVRRKMNRCGMFIFNTPWLISEKLNEILPKLAAMLG